MTRVTASWLCFWGFGSSLRSSNLRPAHMAAHTHFAVATDLAAEQASRPGSFATAFLNVLDAVDPSSLKAKGQVQDAVVLKLC
ncbi:MAG: hypothetical protein ACUVRV_13315 [Cyanobacteriota bacterium]